MDMNAICMGISIGTGCMAFAAGMPTLGALNAAFAALNGYFVLT